VPPRRQRDEGIPPPRAGKRTETIMSKKRILIVGGVAGGASCAARARRMSEEAEIIIFERGAFVSFANCGLPYYVGNVIAEERKLLVATPELFKTRFNIEVRLESTVLSIDRGQKRIEVLENQTGRRYAEKYDALVLSPGAAPLRPPLPGIDLPGIFSLRTIPDSRQIRQWLEEHCVRHVVVVGGGFIGLEMAENLVKRGISVTMLERLPQVMPPLDPEMAVPVQKHLQAKGVTLSLGNAVKSFSATPEEGISVGTSSGEAFEAEMVVLAIGVKPETQLAVSAGLRLGKCGGIWVDHQMKTSDPSIWAVGDAVEVPDFVTGEPTLVPLAGPANRQGRLAADSIFGREVHFRGVQGTAVVGVFDLTIATTGASEKTLKRLGKEYEKVYLHPGHHAGYYPGARMISLKLIFSPKGGKILGAQAVGEAGVERRMDVIAMAIQKGGTVFDLEEAELCYAPQYGTAKDPVNLAGMVAANLLKGDVPTAHWEGTVGTTALIVDVRDPHEHAAGHPAGAINIPLPELRARLAEIPRDREVWVHCGVGQRSYYATRILKLNGFRVKNLSGGFATFKNHPPSGKHKESC